MSINANHAQLVANLAKDPTEVLDELTPRHAHLIHMIMGISGEAGELLDAIKKHAIYQKPLDLENVIEELGDLEFYMQGIRAELGITREETLVHNISKLNKRYEKGYSNKAAQERADKILNISKPYGMYVEDDSPDRIVDK